MPRTLSLLLLMCWAWSQAFAPGCSTQPAASPRAQAAHAAHPHHPAPDERSQRAHLPGDDGPLHHGAAGCALSPACGAYAAARPSIVLAHAPLAVPAAVWPADARYAAPIPSTDPPPPRRPA